MSERLAGLDTRSKVLGGVLLLAVLGLVLRLLLSGGTPEEVLAQPVAAPVPGAQEAPLVDGLPTPAAAPAAPLGSPKDPFLALHVPDTGGGAAAPAAPAPQVPTVPVVEPPADDLGSFPDPVPAPEEPGAGPVDVPVAGPQVDAGPTAEPAPVLVLRAVEGEGERTTATFELDGTTHTATVGEAFATLTLRALQQGPHPGQWTAVLQPAEGDPFDVVSGAPHRL